MRLEVKDLSISLGTKPKKQVLNSVSFAADEGEFLSLLGASGAGKSTLLKTIAGILIQDEGSISFDGKPIDGLAAHKRGVGFVFQDMRLFPHMNVEENVAFPCKMAHMSKKERLERARHLLELVQLKGFGKREVQSLSGGQQQRVALARALAGNPQILLLDEPFSGLDENLRDEIRSLVLNLHRSFEITTIMVTHDALEAVEMSDRVVYLSEGKVVQDASPRELYSAPASHEVAACFGDCSVLDGAIADGAFTRGDLALPAVGLPNGAAKAVIRFAGVSIAGQDSAGAHVGASMDAYAGAARGANTQVDAGTHTPSVKAAKTYSVDAPLQVEQVPLHDLHASENQTQSTLQSSYVVEPLPVRCSVYRGEDYTIRLDVEGQVLTAVSEKAFAKDELLSPTIDRAACFIYPQEVGC